jgi:hypothetical protein
MTRQRPAKRESAVTNVLPVRVRIGDRLVSKSGEWEVTGRPFTTAGGTAHKRPAEFSRQTR